MWLWIFPLVILAVGLSPIREPSRLARGVGIVCCLCLAVVATVRVGWPETAATGGPGWLRPAGLSGGGMLQLDAAGALLAGAILGLGAVVLLALGWHGSSSSPRSAALLLAASCCLVLAADLATLYLAWCLAGLLEAALAGGARSREHWIVARAGDLALLLAILVVGWQTGTLSMTELVDRVGFVWGAGHPAAALAGLAVLGAAATRLSTVPFQGRLVGAARAGSCGGALLLVVPPLLGMALLVRLYPIFFPSPPALAAAAALGAVTAISAALSAAARSDAAGLGFAAAAHGGLALTGLAVGGPGVGLALALALAGARLLAVLAGELAAGRQEPWPRPGTLIVAGVAAVALGGVPWITGVGVALAGALDAAPTGPIGNPSLALLLVMSIVATSLHAGRWLSGVIVAGDGPGAPGTGRAGRPGVLLAAVLLAILLTLAGPPQAATATAAGGWVVDAVGAAEVPAGLERVAPTRSALTGFMAPLLALAAAAGLGLGLGLTALRPDVGAELARSPLVRRLAELAGAGWHVDLVLRRLVGGPLRWSAAAAGRLLERPASRGLAQVRSGTVSLLLRVAGPVGILLLAGPAPAAVTLRVDGLALPFLVALLVGAVGAVALRGPRPSLEVLLALAAAAAALVAGGSLLGGFLWALAVAAATGPAGRQAGRPTAWALAGLALTLPPALPRLVASPSGISGAASPSVAWALATLACALAPALLGGWFRASSATFLGLGAVAAAAGLRAAILYPAPPGPGTALGLAALLGGGLAAAGGRAAGTRVAGWGVAAAGIALVGSATGAAAGLQGAGLLLAATFLALPWLPGEPASGAARRSATGSSGGLLALALAGLPGALPFVGQFLCLSAVLAGSPGAGIVAVVASLPLGLAAARRVWGRPVGPEEPALRAGRSLVLALLVAAGLAPGAVLRSIEAGLVDTARRAIPMEPADPEILDDGRLVTDGLAPGKPAARS